MNRVVEPEWLDELPADDPRAVGSRRDLARLNGWMGHVGIVARHLARVFRDHRPQLITELGAGDGTFLVRVAERLSPRWRDVEVVLVDRQDLVGGRARERFIELGWRVTTVTEDALHWLENSAHSAGDLVLANLFLHHFTGQPLEKLLRVLSSRTNHLVACEPRRSAAALACARLLGLAGCNPVTRHDAPASVRAGFAGTELSRLWPARSGWQLEERPAGAFSHFFSAQRRC